MQLGLPGAQTRMLICTHPHADSHGSSLFCTNEEGGSILHKREIIQQLSRSQVKVNTSRVHHIHIKLHQALMSSFLKWDIQTDTQTDTQTHEQKEDNTVR